MKNPIPFPFLLHGMILIVSSLSYAGTPADTARTKGFKLNEVWVGGSIKEFAHAGLSFGNRNSIGVYGGGWEGIWSAGVSLKRYMKKPGETGSLRPWFTRFAIGVAGNPGYRGTNYSTPPTLELLYFSATWGRDIRFGKSSSFGVSLEGGLMHVPIFDGENSNDIGFPQLLPSISVKFIYKAIRKQ